MEIKPNWLKSKGYLHLTGQINVNLRQQELITKITNPKYVEEYSFYPLIHSSINERKYKIVDKEKLSRGHSFKNSKGQYEKTLKKRPLHYSTHMDTLIFGYYAEIIQEKYEKELEKILGLEKCVIAYRKIKLEEKKDIGKSTIHFANEVFSHIRQRAEVNGDCAVLTFDIKKFFPSLDHKQLNSAWSNLFIDGKMPAAHSNVFKAATKFSYILKDDLRLLVNRKGKRGHFDEKKIANIRNKYGIHSFFENPKELRTAIKNRDLKVYKFPFRNRKKEPVGIPQGLPISAILANLYLLAFDKKIFEEIVIKMGAFYRRYSDDIVIVCNSDEMVKIKSLIKNYIHESLLEISEEKTEEFIFRPFRFGNKEPRLTSIKLLEKQNRCQISAPLLYLGFQFDGNKSLIKSSNLSKFYRRMISSVKRKSLKAIIISKSQPNQDPIIFRRQLYRLYTTRPVNNAKTIQKWKRLEINEYNSYTLVTGRKRQQFKSNYLTYVKRASVIMGEPGILKQVSKHSKIFNESIFRHFTSVKNLEL